MQSEISYFPVFLDSVFLHEACRDPKSPVLSKEKPNLFYCRFIKNAFDFFSDRIHRRTQYETTLLGTGTPIPRIDRFNPCTLVEAGQKKLLFDCGRGA